MPAKGTQRKVLVVDIGGTHVKLYRSPNERREFDSGPGMRPRDFVSSLRTTTEGWPFDAISIGFPSPVRNGCIRRDPKHLGRGWIDFDFGKALKKPVSVINDAAMQALGSYHGKRMLFLGLGTGLGSALVWENNLLPLELSDLPYDNGRVIEKHLGLPALERLGRRKWMREVRYAVVQLQKAFLADYVVLGGGNARFFSDAGDGVEIGNNRNAYRGGIRLWQTNRQTRRRKWRVM
jgi:predicted NBD/HSP70 family sugar kinase